MVTATVRRCVEHIRSGIAVLFLMLNSNDYLICCTDEQGGCLLVYSTINEQIHHHMHPIVTFGGLPVRCAGVVVEREVMSLG